MYVQIDTLLPADVFENFRKELEGIRREICQAILRYAKTNNKYMKDYDRDEEESFLQYNDANNLYGFAISEPPPVDDFEWMEDLSKIDEDFIKNYDKDSDEGYIFDVDVEYPKNLHDLPSHLPFLPERMKIDNRKKLVCNLYDKKKLCCSYKIIKRSIKSWSNIKESSWSNTI